MNNMSQTNKILVTLIVFTVLGGVVSLLWGGNNESERALGLVGETVGENGAQAEMPQVSITLLTVGSGPAAEIGDRATIHYEGTLPDGSVFDSTRAAGKPATFQLGSKEITAGLDQGAFGMRVGEVREIIVPPELAYGETGIPGKIPPKTALRYRVELLKIQKAAPFPL